MSQVNTILQQAVSALQSNDLNTADQLCLRLLKKFPNQPDAFHLLALSAKQRNDFSKSRKYFEKALSLNGNQPVVYSNYANLLASLGEYKKASSRYEKSLRLAPNNLDALYNYSAMLNQTGNYKKAIEKIKKAIAINPTVANFYSLLGRSYGNLEQYTDALNTYDKALKINPQDFFSQHNKGVTFRKIQHPQKAIECYLKIYEQGKNVPEFLFNLGCAYYDLGDETQTEQLLKNAIELKPDYVEAHEALNKFYWENSQHDKFLKSYKNGIAIEQNSPSLRYSYAAHLIMAQREDDAQQVLEDSLKHFGRTPTFSHALAVLIGKKGHYDKALSLIDYAIKREPENTQYRIDMANVLIRQGDYNHALKHIETASRIAPLNQEIWAYKGTCWRLLGDEREQWLNNYDSFIQAKILDTPEGYDNFEHFISEYRSALFEMHTTVRQPLDQSVRGGTQTVGHLLKEPIKVIQDYSTVLNNRVKEYLSSLPDDPEHPFLNRKLANYKFSGCWSVRLKSEGFHINHVHPEGWLSGPTYVNIPSCISPEDPKKSGWVKFGETSMLLGDKEKIALEVCPQPGLCVFFPSYMWHGTHPFESSEYRMTTPCDIMPRD